MIRPRDLKNDDNWAMLRACRDGDLSAVTALLARRPDLATCEYNYTPPIHFAVREGHGDIVRLLVEHGAEVSNYRTYPFQDSLLTLAEDRDHHKVAEYLRELAARKFPMVEGLAEFLDAVESADTVAVQQALARDPDLARATDDTGDTALHRAATVGDLGLVTLLLDAGAHVDAVRADGFRPIHCALGRGRKRPLHAGMIAGVLLGRGAAYNIYLAAVFGDSKYVTEALERDASWANFEDTCHARPISAAARRNDMEMVKELLDHGANPSLPEEGAPLGEALWTAVYQGQYDMAKLLLEHGANPNTAPESSGSALAHTRKDPKMRQLLLDYGAKPDSPEKDELMKLFDDNNVEELERRMKELGVIENQDQAFWGEGILAGPANGGNIAMIEMLLRHGARVPDVSKWGRSYYFKHTNVARLLLERGMNPNHMTWHHVTLLHDMAQKCDMEKARLLLDHGADINAVDEEYRSTPLGFAARWGNGDMVEFLLGRGADPNRAGAAWATPLAWAEKKGHQGIAAMLKQAGAR